MSPHYPLTLNDTYGSSGNPHVDWSVRSTVKSESTLCSVVVIHEKRLGLLCLSLICNVDLMENFSKQLATSFPLNI